MSRSSLLRAAAAALLLPVSTAAAQLTPITVPRKLLRLEFSGKFDNWDQRYVDGVKQDAAAEFTFSPLDGRYLPTLATTVTDLRRITGVQTVTMSLGQTRSAMLVNAGTGGLGAAYGLTSRITLFGTVPLVRVRVQSRFDLDSTDATAGFNPSDPVFGNSTGAAQTTAFLNQLQATLTALSTKITAGGFTDPAQLAAAQAALTRGNALKADLTSLYGSATFLPLAGSAAAGAILTPVEALRTTLAGLGIPNFSLTSTPALPETHIGQEQFEGFFTNASGSLHTREFAAPILQYIGDVEVGAAFAWLDHRPARGLAVRSTVVGTIRLRTGQLEEPDRLFDVGTGDRQPDVQGDLVTDLQRGGFGARLTGRYVLQLSGRRERRVTAPDQPLAPASSTASLEWDPGEIIEASVEPFLRIAPTLSVFGGVRYWTKGEDKYTYVRNQDPIAGASLDDLVIGTKQNGTALSAGVSYVHTGRRSDGTAGFPMDASLRYEKLARSTLGRVEARETVTVSLRFYRKLF